MNGGRLSILGSRALTKIQSVALIAVVVVGVLGGGAAYFLWSANLPPLEDIRIGICADLDGPYGKLIWRGAVLAAEQINAQGGVLGRNFTILGEDDDSESRFDLVVGINALTKLITVGRADFVISPGIAGTLPYQDLCSEHEKVFFNIGGGSDAYSQRVLDNYEKYKYSFRTFPPNETATSAFMLDEVITLGRYTGFSKVALLFVDHPIGKAMASDLSKSLPDQGFEVVYNKPYASSTTDFTSHFAAIEASGAEILVPYMLFQNVVPFVKEWYDRQSPFVLWGTMPQATMGSFWELTDGKCDTVSSAGTPVTSGISLTNKTLLTWQAYIERWGEEPSTSAIPAYDTVRFILFDAIKRAGTTETEAVIKALEATDVETSVARHFVFTSSHDVLLGSGAPDSPVEDYMVICMFQWQNGNQVPVYPESIMKETGASYKYPSWQGPWSSRPNP